jgi:two-component system response regulator AtoC
MPNFSIMIIDDDVMLLRSLYQVFSNKGFSVTAVEDGKSAMAEFEKQPFDIIIADIHLPGRDGIELLKEIRGKDQDCAVVMMTAFASVDTAVSALRLGATDYIIKPFEVEQILLVVNRIIERKRLVEDNLEFSLDARNNYDFSRIVTRSGKFKEILGSLKRVARTDSTILIIGESGTGKELVARAVHTNSDRARRPLISVNCGAIPATLIEAELFGHVKGAFTGAVGDRKGYFERAHGSTLFLDEIGELNLDLQVKLLRVLQEKQICRIGDSRPVDLDFRLIAASQWDLAREAKEGRFRQDLFYRLNVFPVTLPPLRERPEDIEPLVNHLLGRFSRRNIKVSNEALEAFRGYSWPGNVRELENVVERALLMAEGDVIELAHLTPEIKGKEFETRSDEPEIRVEIPSRFNNYKDVIKEVGDLVRRKMILRALSDHDWNVTHSARALGMSRRHLIHKMQQLGLRRSSSEDGEN